MPCTTLVTRTQFDLFIWGSKFAHLVCCCNGFMCYLDAISEFILTQDGEVNVFWSFSISLDMWIGNDPLHVRRQKCHDYLLYVRTRACHLSTILLTAVSLSATFRYFSLSLPPLFCVMAAKKESIVHLCDITRPGLTAKSSQPKNISGDNKTGAVQEGPVKAEAEAVGAGSPVFLESGDDNDDEVHVCVRCGGMPCYWSQNGDEVISAVIRKFGSDLTCAVSNETANWHSERYCYSDDDFSINTASMKQKRKMACRPFFKKQFG